MKRKNILIFCHHPAIQFIDICNQYVNLFDKNKYHVTVAYLIDPADELVRQKTHAEEVIFFEQTRKSVRGLKLAVLIKLFSLCRKRKFEMVICHRYKPIYLFLLLGQFFKIPKIFFVMHALGTMKSLARKILVKLLIRKNMLLAGVSNAVRDDLRQSLAGYIPPEKVITLYNSVDDKKITASFVEKNIAREKLQLPIDSFVFATMGRFHWMKDQPTMLRAFAKIHQQCSNAVLILLGNGEEELALRKIAKQLNIQDKVVFAGFIEKGYQYARAFDVFLLTSVREGFGFVLPEVMLAKVPAIGTRIGGIPEIVGDTGIIIPAQDDQALAAAMLKFYQMTSAERLFYGEKARQQIIDKFSWDKFQQDF